MNGYVVGYRFNQDILVKKSWRQKNALVPHIYIDVIDQNVRQIGVGNAADRFVFQNNFACEK